METTQSALIIQNSAMTELFIGTGMITWGLVALVGIITIGAKAFRGFVPKKVKAVK